MPKIKWIGIIQGNLAEYQRGELPENARKLRMPETTQEMQIKALPFLLPPFILIFMSLFFKTFVSKQVVVSPLFALTGFIAGFPALLMHEYLHAIVYPKEATVSIGFYPKSFAAVALASYPLQRNRFLLMSLLPVVLGILPVSIFWFVPADMTAINGFLFGFSIMGLISPYPDFYNVYQVIRQTPKDCRIQSREDNLYWIE